MPFNIGPGELIIVLIIALIVVGPGKLPDVGSALGKSIREFRRAAADVKETTTLETSAPPASAPAPAPQAPAPAAQPAPQATAQQAPVPTAPPAPSASEPVAVAAAADAEEQTSA